VKKVLFKELRCIVLASILLTFESSSSSYDWNFESSSSSYDWNLNNHTLALTELLSLLKLFFGSILSPLLNILNDGNYECQCQNCTKCIAVDENHTMRLQYKKLKNEKWNKQQWNWEFLTLLTSSWRPSSTSSTWNVKWSSILPEGDFEESKGQ